MRSQFIITGTDTDVGKTIFSAALMLGLDVAGHNPHYWKPIQSGVADTVDTKRVQNLTQLPHERFFPEKYILTEPLSPHRSAELDGVEIDVKALSDPKNIPLPEDDCALIIEGAGGLMVPLSRDNLLINLFQKWQIPVVLCTRTSLGTLNHTLLSLEALWARDIPIKGIVFIGDENEDNMKTVADFSKEKILGRLPLMEDLDDTMLRLNFANHFDVKDFIA